MKTKDAGYWFRVYLVPAILLTASFGATVAAGYWLFDADLDLIWMLASPLLVIAIGYLTEPRRLWVMPLIAVLIIHATATAVGGGEAFLIFIPPAIILTAIWSGAIWLGRELHRRGRRPEGDRSGLPLRPA